MGRYFKIKRYDISFSAVPKKGYDIRVFGVPKKEQAFGQIGHPKKGGTNRYPSSYFIFGCSKKSNHLEILEALKKGKHSDISDTLKRTVLRNAKVGNDKEKVRIVGKCRYIHTS